MDIDGLWINQQICHFSTIIRLSGPQKVICPQATKLNNSKKTLFTSKHLKYWIHNHFIPLFVSFFSVKLLHIFYLPDCSFSDEAKFRGEIFGRCVSLPYAALVGAALCLAEGKDCMRYLEWRAWEPLEAGEKTAQQRTQDNKFWHGW